MITKEQINIFSVFRKDIFAGVTFKEIKTQSRQKSNSVVQMALKKFREDALVKTQKTGNVAAYFLNLDNNLTLAYLGLINNLQIKKNKKIPKNILNMIKNSILKYSEFFILIVFGSYAKNKQTAKSDLDIAVIVETEDSKKEISPYVETIKRRELTKIDYHLFTRNAFLEMLLTDKENVGKEIYRKNIIFYGTDQYYNLIRGVKHGIIS